MVGCHHGEYFVFSALTFRLCRISNADTEISKEVRFWDLISTANLETADLAVMQEPIAGFGADPKNLTHLIDTHNIGVFPQHNLVCVTLRNG